MRNNKGLFKNSLFYIVAFLILMGVFFFATSNKGETHNQEIQSSQFVKQLKDNKVKNFSVQPSDGVYNISGQYREAQETKSNSGGSFLFGSSQKATKVSSFKANVLKNNSTITEITNYAKKNDVKMNAKEADTNGGFWTNLLISVVPMLIILVFFFIMMNQAGGKNGGKVALWE